MAPQPRSYLTRDRQEDMTSLGGRNVSKDRLDNRISKPMQRRRPHEIRTAAVSRSVEPGGTEFEIMAVPGNSTSKVATRYARAADQKTPANRASKRLREQQKSIKSPTFRLKWS